VRMYDTDFVEKLLGVEIGDNKPEPHVPAKPYEEYFSDGGSKSVRHLGQGSRIREKMTKEDRQAMGWGK